MINRLIFYKKLVHISRRYPFENLLQVLSFEMVEMASSKYKVVKIVAFYLDNSSLI